MQLVSEERFAQGLLYFAFTRLRGLPGRETDQAHDLVDVSNHPLNDDEGLGRLDLVEQLRQGRFASTLVLLGGLPSRPSISPWQFPATFSRTPRC